MKKILLLVAVTVVSILPFTAQAELPWQLDQHTRYMALGDSIAAGYGAIPATQGYVYLLYQEGIFDTVQNTLFCNAAVPGATSKDVLDYQIPQVALFHPNVITLTVGGNDLLAIMEGADPGQVLNNFALNFQQILYKLRTTLPDANLRQQPVFRARDCRVRPDRARFQWHSCPDRAGIQCDGHRRQQRVRRA